MTIEQAIGKFLTVIVDPLVTLGFAVALLLFFWGLFKFMLSVSDGNVDNKVGKNHMLWGLVGMFIMFSVGGIINFISGTIGANPADQQIEIQGGFR